MNSFVVFFVFDAKFAKSFLRFRNDLRIVDFDENDISMRDSAKAIARDEINLSKFKVDETSCRCCDVKCCC